MTARRAWIDPSPLEVRGVVELDGEPEHLLIEREGEAGFAQLGTRHVGRVTRTLPRGSFAELGDGPPGWIASDGRARVEGAVLEVEVAAEARAGKGPRLRVLGAAEGGARRLSEAPSLEQRLRRLVGDDEAPIGEGRAAREAADTAQAAVLAVVHALGGGVTLAIQPTRALVAVDVDVDASAGASTRRGAGFGAVRAAARLLRLKSLGGTIVIDIAGLRPAPAPLRAEAKAAFAPDGPDVRIWPPAGPGLLLVTTPHRRRPVHERLVGPGGEPTLATRAAEALRALVREAVADPGARFRIDAEPELGVEMASALARLGPRFSFRPTLGAGDSGADIVRL